MPRHSGAGQNLGIGHFLIALREIAGQARNDECFLIAGLAGIPRIICASFMFEGNWL
jgi:hypothetical protein